MKTTKKYKYTRIKRRNPDLAKLRRQVTRELKEMIRVMENDLNELKDALEDTRTGDREDVELIKSDYLTK